MQRHDAIVSVGLLILVAANADAGTLQIVDDLPGKFMDISQTGGTALNLGDDEEVDIGTFPGNFVFLTGPVVVANNGGLVELLTTQSGTTWTLIITLPNGMTCLLAAGEDWEAVPMAQFGERT